MNSLLKVCQIFWHTLKKKLIIIISIAATVVLESCTTELPFEPDHTDKSIVINSVFSPADPFKISFSFTEYINFENIDINRVFDVKLFEDDLQIIDTILYSDTLVSTRFPKANKVYTIEASCENYLPIRATDTILTLVSIDNAWVIIPAGVDEYGQEIAEAQISITDPINEKNFYEILIYSIINGKPKSYWLPNGDSRIIDPVLINEGDMDYLPSSYFFSDELFNGQEYTMRIRSTGGGFGPENGITLRSVSRSYYLYRKYFTKHAYSQQYQGDFLDILFMGEPQNMYTNIENGYGIFVGYQETSRILKQK